MSVVVFRGPTVTAAEVRAILPAADCRPPAGQGDLHRAVEAGARTVVLIDGTFERGPAVWHKEILHALQNGVAVLGAASMGALRAVECAPFGMRGAGQIVAWFADGTLTDDDEVTVAHLDAEHDWCPVSEALVNIRATLAAAVAANVLAIPAAQDIIAIAKGIFYPERSWPGLLAAARGAGIDVTALAGWLPEGRIDLKKTDARALLREVAAEPETPPRTDGWRLESSRVWLRARAAMAAGAGGAALEAVLDDLRLDDAYYEIHQAALLRRLAVAEADRHGVHPDPAVAAAELRVALGLTDDARLAEWMATNDLDEDGLHRLAVDQARLGWVHRRYGDDVTSALADQLRIRGWYRAATPPADAVVDERDAWDWYAVTRDLDGRGWPDPRHGDQETAALASHLGFASPDDLRHAVRRAYAARS